MIRTLAARRHLSLALLDASILTAVAVAPAAAHALAVPLYLWEPMRIGLFAALLLAGRANGYALAVAMPLLAFATSGHPAPPKLMLIQGELAVNVLLFHALMRGLGRHRFVFAMAAAASVVGAKAAYYGAKFALLKAGALDGALVSTPWQNQAAVLLLVALAGQSAWWVRQARQARRP